ncbi:MAG: radical SAM protein, partial [Candidatus Omnitrophota bacterium]
LGIYLRNGIRADKVDRELLHLMKLSGVMRVAFAPESGSQQTLDTIIKKRLKLKDAEKAVRLAKEEGLDVTCFLVIGFPEEDMGKIKQTIAFGRRLRRIGCDTLWISCAVPYPGTELYCDCLKRGILSPGHLDYQSLSPSESVIHNECFSSQEVTKMARDFMLELNQRGLRDSLRVANRRFKLLVNHPGMALKKSIRYFKN